MKCPKHDRELTLLFLSARCDECDGLSVSAVPGGDIYWAYSTPFTTQWVQVFRSHSLAVSAAARQGVTLLFQVYLLGVRQEDLDTPTALRYGCSLRTCATAFGPAEAEVLDAR